MRLADSSNYDITPPHATFVWLLLSSAALPPPRTFLILLSPAQCSPGPSRRGSLNIYLVKPRHLACDITTLANSGTGQDNFWGFKGKYLKTNLVLGVWKEVPSKSNNPASPVVKCWLAWCVLVCSCVRSISLLTGMMTGWSLVTSRDSQTTDTGPPTLLQP